MSSEVRTASTDIRNVIALAGNPNCGKTALFNALTGGRQKVGNYAGVTVERKEGGLVTPSGMKLSLLDLPGTYSLDAKTPDEAITRDVLLGRVHGESRPGALVAVADATNLERSLGLVLELKRLGTPVVLALNMMDLARGRGLDLDIEVLSEGLGVRVVPTVAVSGEGLDELLNEVERLLDMEPGSAHAAQNGPGFDGLSEGFAVRRRFEEVDRILGASVRKTIAPTLWTDRIDTVVLHPVWGVLTLAILLGVMFQAIFSWASVPADWIEAALSSVGAWLGSQLPEGPLQSLLVDGIVAGVGSVLVFLPQILLLFFFILLLEDSGYMARAAFLMDRIMGRVGLHGRAFIPLLSGYACAIPAVMATRTIDRPRDRLVTILIAPLMTCSARLPVYTLLISAFIPRRALLGGLLNLQGLVMFALYASGIGIALIVAWLLNRTAFKGDKSPLLLELPTYKWPSLKNLAIGLLDRSKIFVRRAGTVILSLSILLWFVSSYPKAPEGAAEPAIHYSYAGKLGRVIEPVLEPLGFDWRVGVALVPSFAAREVMVSALATVYAVEGGEEEAQARALEGVLATSWSLATALALLVWYVLAPQCISTLAVVRRETNSWKWPLVVLFYLTTLAYIGSWLTYRAALALGLG
jgi:ferrous iron transport protein B